MPRVLVTGMSGTGKSTVLAELARRGIRTVDTDDGGWSVEVPDPDGPGLMQLWREESMERLLEELSFDAHKQAGQTVTIDAAPVDAKLGELARNEDLSRFIL